MRVNLLKLLVLTLFVIAHFLQGKDFVQYVNPLMGTQSSFELSAGNTYPAIARPWGMNFWTPQTGKMGDGWQYTYNANKIRGFKQTHQPSPWINDYGQFSIMPITRDLVFSEDERASWFSHKGEVATPNYYKVYLAEHDVEVELTPTERAALFRFTFPESKNSYIVIDAFHKGNFKEQPYIRIDPENRRIVGYTTRNSGGVSDNFKNYFVIELDKDISFSAIVADGTLLKDVQEKKADHVLAIVGFSSKDGEKVHAKVASSFISEQQAMLNLGELGDKDFDYLVAEGRREWNKVLGRIDVEGDNIDYMRTFYSCLYRSLLFPRKLYEIDKDGNIVHYSPYNGKVCGGYMFTDTGFWDTFRSLFPLLNLMYPEVNSEIQEALLNVYRESGFFPEWSSPGHRGCMIGNNSASVLVDAFVKGIKFEDAELLYEGLIKGTCNVHPQVSSVGRLGFEYYNKLGYVPYDVGIRENAARTLEYAYSDWCIYRLAKALNKPDSEVNLYRQRAQNYKKLFDAELKLMRGRNKDGSFAEPFSPLKWGDAFTEGNSWHYTWSVFHDIKGLINLMGGNENFISMLDKVFALAPAFDESYYGIVIHEIREMTVINMGNYAHGNQPIQHMIYLYNYAGAPWKSQYWLREVVNRMYSPTPDGYCGDEDNGQTSAWYVFTALGFYPVCPGSDEYVLGAPLFDKVKLNFPSGKTTEINAAGSGKNRYVSEMKIDGNPYDKNYIKHDVLTNGCDIDFTMSEVPNKSRGTQSGAFPYSLSDE